MHLRNQTPVIKVYSHWFDILPRVVLRGTQWLLERGGSSSYPPLPWKKLENRPLAKNNVKYFIFVKNVESSSLLVFIFASLFLQKFLSCIGIKWVYHTKTQKAVVLVICTNGFRLWTVEVHFSHEYWSGPRDLLVHIQNANLSFYS